MRMLLKGLVADAGYDFSKLVLRRSVDVTDCLRALSCASKNVVLLREVSLDDIVLIKASLGFVAG